jgi:hypothetical protein
MESYAGRATVAVRAGEQAHVRETQKLTETQCLNQGRRLKTQKRNLPRRGGSLVEASFSALPGLIPPCRRMT